jgi:hypothetical protein
VEGTSDGALITAYIGLKDEGPSGLLFRKSPDGGQTWSAPEKIIGLGNSQEDPDVRVYAPKILESTLGTYHVLFPTTRRGSPACCPIRSGIACQGMAERRGLNLDP